MSKCENPNCEDQTQVYGCKYCPRCYPAFSRMDDLERLNESLRQQLAEAEAKIKENALPNEQGKNRYGLDMAYFRNLINRELNRPLVDFKPDELARVFARAARTADKSVLSEPEFLPSEAKNVGVCLLGIKGRAFDPPNTRRAYTYWDQPMNVEASKIGECCFRAYNQRAGDHIDRGLLLLKELHAAGFGIFELTKESGKKE